MVDEGEKVMESSVMNTLIGSATTLIGMLVTIATIRLTAKNDRGTHISKTRFDKEFEIYQELSEKNLTAVYDAGEIVLIVRGLYDDEPEMKTKHLEKLCESMNDAEFSNKKYAPFINKKIFQNYKNLENLIKDIFTMFKFWMYDDGFNLSYKGQSYTHEESKQYIENKQKEISVLSDKILDDVRKYLQHLDIVK